MKPIAFTLTLLALALFAIPGFAEAPPQNALPEAEIVEAPALDWEALSNPEALPFLTPAEAPATVAGLLGTTNQLTCIEGGSDYCESDADCLVSCVCRPNNCCTAT